MKKGILPLILASALLLGACGGGGSSGPAQPATGRLSLKVGDAPVDGASEVVIVFTGLELHSNGATTSIDFAEPMQVDLLDYQDGATVSLLEGREVAAGEYQWMRLKVIAERNRNDGSWIKFEDGRQFPLYVPSGSQSGLKLNRPFRVAAGGITRLVADFDLRKSILAPRGQDPNYLLKPVLRLMDELEAGTLEGEVDPAALASAPRGGGAGPADCAAGLYLFTGGDATPDDADGDAADGADPLVYKPLPFDGTNAVVPYTFAFVEAGTYTLAATCQFDVDESPEASEYDPGAADGAPGFGTMQWTVAGDIVVAANQVTVVDLP